MPNRLSMRQRLPHPLRVADVGFGTAGPPDCGGLTAALASIGVALADIDIVYLTHFHGDHVADAGFGSL